MQRADPDGSNIEDLVVLVVTTPRAAAVDPVAGRIYWVEDGFGNEGGLFRANLDGTGATQVVGGVGGGTPGAAPGYLALHGGSGQLYWTDEVSSNLIARRGNVNGGSSDEITGPDVYMPRGFALELADQEIYWGDGEDNAIRRANLDGSAREDAVTGLTSPLSISLDLPLGSDAAMSFSIDSPTTRVPCNSCASPEGRG